MIACRAIIIAAFCLSATLATPFSPCDEKEPVPKELRVKGCDAEPCLLYRGEDVVAEWDFDVVADTDNLKTEVKATALGVTIPYALPQPDACKSLTNGECPLDKDETLTYGLKMPVRREYPKVSLGLKFALKDDSGNVHVCFKLNAKVADRK